MSFAENLKNARKTSGMTQEQLAEKLHIDRSSVAKYESGTSLPSIKSLPEICEILNITVQELLL